MHQLYTFAQTAAVCAALFITACNSGIDCNKLAGRWTNREGREFIFQSNDEGTGLWLTRFGSGADTMAFRFLLDCTRSPFALNMTDFSGGAHIGKTLYAILEFTSDTTFRLRYESGQDESDRPTAFDPETTIKFYREE